MNAFKGPSHHIPGIGVVTDDVFATICRAIDHTAGRPVSEVYLVVDGVEQPISQWQSPIPYYVLERDASVQERAAVVCRVASGRRLCRCGM